MVGEPAAQAPHRPFREPPNGSTAEPAVGAGDEGPGAAPDLDTPPGAVRHGHAPVDEVDGPILRSRGGPTAVLPAVRRVRELPARPYPCEATVPSGPVLVPSKPRDASLPTSPSLHVLRPEAPLGLRMGRREPVIPAAPFLGPVPEATSVGLIPEQEMGRRVAVAATVAGLATPILLRQVLVAAEPSRPTTEPTPAALAVRQDAPGLGALIAGPPMPHPPAEAA